MKGFKVVQLRDKELGSHTFFRNAGVIYEINKPAYPRIENSPLMAFNTLEAAGDWLDGIINITQHKVYECEYTRAEFDAYMLLAASEMHQVTLEKYWSESKVGFKWVAPPQGTVFAKSITLLRECTIEELEEAGFNVITKTYAEQMEESFREHENKTQQDA